MKTLVGKVEAKLCAVNAASESWPMDFELWAPEIVGARRADRAEVMLAVECAQPSEGNLPEIVR